MDGTTDGTFRVTPSDTRIEQTVNVPVPSVDQTYSATSPNAQSGTAVAEAVAEGVQVGPRYITASNVPPLPQMLQASPDSEGNAVRYTMRVTNNTDADTPAFTQFRFNDISITVQMTDNTVPAFGTRYYTFTLTQEQVNAFINNFGSRTANSLVMRYGTGTNEVDITVLDDVGSEAAAIHYEFRDGTNGRFTVIPSDTGQEQVVLTGSDISLWRADTAYRAGQIVLRTAETTETVDGETIVVASAGGLFIATRNLDPSPTFSTAGFVPVPLTEVEWAGKLFDPRGFYERGDIATTIDAVTLDRRLWILNSTANQDGRATAIPEDDRPDGANGAWVEIMAGGGHTIQDPDGNPETQRANLQFTGDVTVTDDATNDRTVVNVTGGGTGQLGYSVEQIGVITAAASEPASTYRWHDGQAEINFGGLNGMAYLSPPNGSQNLTNASASNEDIFNASGEFINNTPSYITIRSFDIDMNVETLGDGAVMTIDPVVIHAVSDDPVARTYSAYNPIRIDSQGNSILGVRTFRFDLGVDTVLAPGDAISLTLTNLVSNQSTDITAVRWSSNTDSWLNTVYPLGAGEYTDAQARDAVNARVVGNNLLINDANDQEITFSGGSGIMQVATTADLPTTGQADIRLVLVQATNELYRWDTSLDTPAWVIIDDVDLSLIHI